MKITIGKMDKKINSTKHEFTGETTFTVDAKLKEPCDEDNPTFLLKYNDGYEQCNYVFVPKWGYYWVTDRVHPTNELIELSCHKDVLATGIPYLKSNYMYASYCSDSTIATEGHIMDDPRLGPDAILKTAEFKFTDDTQSESIINKHFVDDPADGTVLMTVMGKDAGPITYALTVVKYAEVCKDVATGAALDSIDNFFEQFWGNDWHSAVLSALYVPIKKASFDSLWSQKMSDLWWGNVRVSLGEEVHVSKSPIAWATKTYTIELPFHDKLKTDRSIYAFLKGEKYTEVSFQGPTGAINLSSDAFKYSNKLKVIESFSLLDGTFTMKFFAEGLGSAPIGQYSCQLGWDWMKQTSFMSSHNEQAYGVMRAGISMLPSVAAALMGAGAATGAVEGGIVKNAGGKFLREYSMKTGENAYGAAMRAEMSQVSSAIGGGEAISTGIQGAFAGGAAGSLCKAGGSSAGIEGYFFKEGDSWKSRDSFHITVATNAPAVCILIDNSGKADLNETGLARFRVTYGTPCNKLMKIDDVKAPYCYLQTVGASIGMDWEYQTTTTEWPLDLKELAELNGLLNSGIYLEEIEDKPEE